MTTPDPAPTDTAPKRRREPSRRRILVRRALLGVGVLVLVLGVGAAAAIWKLQGNIDKAPLTESVVKDKTPKGAMNILFIGSDSRDLGTDEYGKGTGSQRSDALMLVHFSKGNTRIDAVQIPRDTLLDLPACKDTGSGAFAGGTDQMINAALDGGPACSVKAVETLSDVRIDHFVQLDFDGFASMVNALGGVNVCLDEALVDKDAKLDLPAGEQKIKGKDALALARTRHAVGDGSDIGRLGHQQVVMSSIINQARSTSVLTRPDKLFKFVNALTSSITVDEGISSIPDLTGLAKRARAVPDSGITFVTMPNGAAPQDVNRVVKTDDADTIFKAIKKDQEMPVEGEESTDADGDSGSGSGSGDGTGTSDPRSTPVRVLNAAQTSGLGTSAQTAMTGLGYTVSGVATAQRPATATRIFVDGTPQAQATAEAINADFGFGAEIVRQDITGVWLIIGADRIEAGTDPVKPKPVKATSRKATDSLCV
ncbi:LCP family protein [Aeromicrobium fastidiosum]|uniref:LCP family protein n=1 Tax=Aeromicrobium fastidiosum TaxID=52699 RepID=UPI00202357AF|nr:LCP family protein [Aeromicrobium fastidiosum]MCL8252854.1 LCP family protein [Aeromicrobium fastidiosum]